MDRDLEKMKQKQTENKASNAKGSTIESDILEYSLLRTLMVVNTPNGTKHVCPKSNNISLSSSSSSSSTSMLFKSDQREENYIK